MSKGLDMLRDYIEHDALCMRRRKCCEIEDALMQEMDSLKAENDKLRELCTDLVRLPAVSGFDCYGCKYDEWTDCRMDCKLIERAIELGIEVK